MILATDMLASQLRALQTWILT